MKLKLILLITALVFSLTVQAGDEAPATEKPSISASQTIQMIAVVEAIDREARTVTLKGPQGNSHTINARPDSNNIDRIKVGDKVDVEYVQQMTIEVFANEGIEPGSGVIAASGVNKEGENPAGMEVLTSVTTAVVEDINIEANTFKLRWPNGDILQYEAQNPENLKKSEVGDLVVLTFTEAIAMALAVVPAE